MVYKRLFFLLACLYTFGLSGQGYTDIVSFGTEYFPLETGGEKFGGTRSALNVLLPVALSKEKSRYLLAGLNADAIRFADVPEAFGVDRFFGFSPVVGYTGPLPKDYKVTAIFTPFLNGDFKRTGDRDFRLAGFVRLAKKVTESFTWRVTLGYRQQFFGPQYVLLAGVDWKASERLRLFGDLPQQFTVSYRCGKQVHAGLSYVANLFSYDVSGQSRYFRYSYVHSGLFSEFSLTGNIVLRADAGYSFTRKFEVFQDTDRPDATLIFFQIGNKPVPLNPPLQKGVVFRLSLAYRIF